MIEPISDEELAQIEGSISHSHPKWPVDNWWNRLKARLDAAEAVIARLPKTADGVPVVPGQEMFFIGVDGVPIKTHYPSMGRESFYTCGCYSTREAAEAAMKENAR